MSKTKLHHDHETYSELDLTEVGVAVYSRHPSTEILMTSYAFDDGPVKQWVPAEGEPMPRDLREGLTDPEVIKFAWNKSFEWNIWKNVEGIEIPHNQWRDPMVLAFGLSLPGQLEKAGKVVELPEDKQKVARGKALVRKFCGPRTPTKAKPWRRSSIVTDPEEWEEFLFYNRQDVEAERAIWRRIRRWDMSPQEWELWFLDQEINEAGIPINLRVVENAIRVYHVVVEKRLAEMRELTGLENPNSGKQLLPWLRDHGYPFFDLRKGHVQRAIDGVKAELAKYESEGTVHFGVGSLTNEERRHLTSVRQPITRELLDVLELRQEVSKSSVKKYNALWVASNHDEGVLRNAFQFAGAGRTWRWSARKYQPQNLARPVPYLEAPEAQAAAVRHLEFLDAEAIELIYDKPMDLLSTCVRPVVQAPEGQVFDDSDLNAIENRVLGWLSGDRKILRVFELGRDPYVDFSTYMFGGTYAERWAEYKGGNKSKRTTSKPAVLGCGYMLGPGEEIENEDTGEIEATGLLGYAWNMGVKLTPEQSKTAVKVFRSTYTDVVEFWRAIDKAARRCIRTKALQRVGHITFDISGPFMRMGLPSGRHLHYCRPRIQDAKTPWGEVRPTITYEGLNDKNHWARVKTHPGKLTENADQAVSRDLLAHGMKLAKKRGLDIRLHVHDQLVTLSREDAGERNLKILEEAMSEPPPWARDLPLAAKGMVSKIFIKD